MPHLGGWDIYQQVFPGSNTWVHINWIEDVSSRLRNCYHEVQRKVDCCFRMIGLGPCVLGNLVYRRDGSYRVRPMPGEVLHNSRRTDRGETLLSTMTRPMYRPDYRCPGHLFCVCSKDNPKSFCPGIVHQRNFWFCLLKAFGTRRIGAIWFRSRRYTCTGVGTEHRSSRGMILKPLHCEHMLMTACASCVAFSAL